MGWLEARRRLGRAPICRPRRRRISLSCPPVDVGELRRRSCVGAVGRGEKLTYWVREIPSSPRDRAYRADRRARRTVRGGAEHLPYPRTTSTVGTLSRIIISRRTSFGATSRRYVSLTPRAVPQELSPPPREGGPDQGLLLAFVVTSLLPRRVREGVYEQQRTRAQA